MFLAVSILVAQWAVKVSFGADYNAFLSSDEMKKTTREDLSSTWRRSNLAVRSYNGLWNQHDEKHYSCDFGVCVCVPSSFQALTPNLRQPATNATKHVFIILYLYV